MKSYAVVLLVGLSYLVPTDAQEVDLRKYAIDARGTILSVASGSGILSKNTWGVFGPLHPDPRTSGQIVYESIDPKTGEHVSMVQVQYHREVPMPWVRTPVVFPELIFIGVDTRGLIDDA